MRFRSNKSHVSDISALPKAQSGHLTKISNIEKVETVESFNMELLSHMS